MRSLSALAIILTTGLPGTLAGQDAPYRIRIAALVAELDTCMTVASVNAIAAARPKAKSEGVANLENGFIALRRGVLAADADAIVGAWGQLELVADARPSWPWAQLGVAIAAMEIYSRRAVAPARYKGAAGGTHYDGFIFEMKEMLKREPSFEEGMRWLTATLVQDGDRDQPATLMKLLSFAVDSLDTAVPPDAFLALSRDQRTRGNLSASARHLNRYVRAGGDSGIMLLDLARTEAMQGNLIAAAETYESGLNVETRAGRLAFLADLEWVATDAEMTRIESLPFDAVPGAIRSFWRTRDQLDLRDDGARLREHLRRWAYAYTYFRVVSPERRTAYREVFISTATEICFKEGPTHLGHYSYRDPLRSTGYRHVEFALDHRAVVYMRHGEPWRRYGGSGEPLDYGPTDRATNANPTATGTGTNDLPFGIATQDPANAGSGIVVGNPREVGTFYVNRNTTWVYNLAGALRTFNFYGHEAMGMHQPTTLVLHRPPPLDVLLQLSAIDPAYARIAGTIQAIASGAKFASPPACMQWWQDVVAAQREATAIAVSTDTYRKRFDLSADARMQTFVLGQPELGTGQLVVALGVNSRSLVADSTSDAEALRYRFDVEIRAIDTLTGRAVRASRERMVERPRREPHQWFQLLATLRLDPGLSAIRVGVEQGTARGTVLADTARPAGTADPLAMSDVVLGTTSDPAFRTLQGRQVSVSAFSEYPGDGALQIYHEIYGTTAGEVYETRITLSSAQHRRVASALTFSDVASGATLVSQRSLALSEVAPGEYRLRVEVAPVAGGAAVSRERTIIVRPVRR